MPSQLVLLHCNKTMLIFRPHTYILSNAPLPPHNLPNAQNHENKKDSEVDPEGQPLHPFK